MHYEEGAVDEQPVNDPHAKKEASEETADLDITSQEGPIPVSMFKTQEQNIRSLRSWHHPF